MARRLLKQPMHAYRIGDPDGEFEIYSGLGAAQHPGRWNAVQQPVIYASEHYSTAMLELLVYLGEMPRGQCYVEIEIPAGVSYEVVTKDSLAGWSAASCEASRTFGSAWFEAKRSAVLIVPSVVARLDRNVVINPEHPDASRIRVGLEQPVPWDARLFGEQT